MARRTARGTLDERIAELDRHRRRRSSASRSTGTRSSSARGESRAGAAPTRSSQGCATTGSRRSSRSAARRAGRTAAARRSWAPTSGSTFAAFAAAAAKRYPCVKKWLVWNEPNQRRWLRPTSPRTYVTKLLNPAYAAIHRATPRRQGRRRRHRAARLDRRRLARRLRSAAWRARGARLDAYAHHPYPLGRSRRRRPGGCAHCETITMATLERLLREVVARLRLAEADLADRVRLPDEPARPHPRRLACAAGALPRRGGAAASYRGAAASTC